MENVTVSPSELDWIMACAFGHHLKYGIGYQPIDAKSSFEKGTIVHEMLKVHYRGIMAGKPYAELVEEAATAGRVYDQKTSLSPKDSEFLVAKYRQYASHYQGESLKPLAVEEWFNRELVEIPELGKRIILFGKIDMIGEKPVDNVTKQTIVENKSGERMFQPTLTDNQFMAYTWATGIPRIMRNGFGLQESYSPMQRFKRESWEYTESQLEEWRQSVIHWVKEYFKNEANNYFPRNHASCQNRYGKCLFYDACVAPPEVRDRRLAAYYTRITR